MAMKLNGEDRDTIRKQSRWSSDTFLMHIHEQIADFSSGISKRMSRHIPVLNLKGPTVVRAHKQTKNHQHFSSIKISPATVPATFQVLLPVLARCSNARLRLHPPPTNSDQWST
jgi:hypothetical protein